MMVEPPPEASVPAQRDALARAFHGQVAGGDEDASDQWYYARGHEAGYAQGYADAQETQASRAQEAHEQETQATEQE